MVDDADAYHRLILHKGTNDFKGLLFDLVSLVFLSEVSERQSIEEEFISLRRLTFYVELDAGGFILQNIPALVVHTPLSFQKKYLESSVSDPSSLLNQNQVVLPYR